METELENEYDSLKKELEEKGSKIMRGINETKPRWSPHGKFGLCATCVYLEFAETDFHILFARCGCFGIMLHTGEPVTQCSIYQCKGQLSLDMMIEIATLIDDKGSKPIAPFSNQKK
jgi:hypothetical protein